MADLRDFLGRRDREQRACGRHHLLGGCAFIGEVKQPGDLVAVGSDADKRFGGALLPGRHEIADSRDLHALLDVLTGIALG